MAVLQNNGGGSGLRIQEQCPAGTHVAVIGHIEDQFGVERRKFENPQETESRDVTKFYFGVLAGDGQAYRVGTYEMRISGNPKAKLYKFLSDLLGAPPPQGWDYCELEGRGAIIRVEEKISQAGNPYSIVTAVRPVDDGLTDYTDRIPSLDQFSWEGGEEDANNVPQQAAAAGQPASAPRPQPTAPVHQPTAPVPQPTAPVPQPTAPAPQTQAQRPPLPDPANENIPF